MLGSDVLAGKRAYQYPPAVPTMTPRTRNTTGEGRRMASPARLERDLSDHRFGLTLHLGGDAQEPLPLHRKIGPE
jgi:hypothetical protein